MHYIAQYGFDVQGKEVGKVQTVLKKIANTLVSNLLNNGRYMLDACNCKTLTEGHLGAIYQIQHKVQVQKSQQKGGAHGGTVLPSEYFGGDSGRYVDMASLAGQSTELFADSSVLRPAMDIKMAGGGPQKTSMLTMTELKDIVKMYHEKNGTSFKINKNAITIIKLSLDLNMDMLMSHLSENKRGSTLTADSLKDVVKRAEFMHMNKLARLPQAIVKSTKSASSKSASSKGKRNVSSKI